MSCCRSNWSSKSHLIQTEMEWDTMSIAFSYRIVSRGDKPEELLLELELESLELDELELESLELLLDEELLSSLELELELEESELDDDDEEELLELSSLELLDDDELELSLELELEELLEDESSVQSGRVTRRGRIGRKFKAKYVGSNNIGECKLSHHTG